MRDTQLPLSFLKTQSLLEATSSVASLPAESGSLALKGRSQSSDFVLPPISSFCLEWTY